MYHSDMNLKFNLNFSIKSYDTCDNPLRFTCIHVGVENIWFLKEVILPHGRVPVRRDFLPRDVTRNSTARTTIEIVTYVPVISVVERVSVRQMIRPRLGIFAQLQRYKQ